MRHFQTTTLLVCVQKQWQLLRKLKQIFIWFLTEILPDYLWAVDTSRSVKNMKHFWLKTCGGVHFRPNNNIVRRYYSYLYKENRVWFTQPVICSMYNGISVECLLSSIPTAAFKTAFIHLIVLVIGYVIQENICNWI